MNKLLLVLITCSLFTSYSVNMNNVNTIAIVSLVGSKIKAEHTIDIKKYPRSECPVCEGKGWYLSGDKIKKVECQYCEPDQK